MRLDLYINKGASFFKYFRWEGRPYIYKDIQAISQDAPCLLTVPAHGLLQDQLFLIQSARGMTELNASAPDKPTDWYMARVLDEDHVEINNVDSSWYPAYEPGTGVIKYRTLADLKDYTARMYIRQRIDGDIYYEATTEIGNIVIDTALQFVKLLIPDEDTEMFQWKKGTYDLELMDPYGNVTRLVEGKVFVSKENTTEP